MVKTFVATPIEKMLLRTTAPTHARLQQPDQLITHLNALPSDCLFNIFDYLHLKHLYRLSLQSERIKIVANDYISKNFKGKQNHIKLNRNNHIVYDSPIVPYFLESMQTITIHGSSSPLFHHIGPECHLKPKTIIFKNLISKKGNNSHELGNSMKNAMENVHSVEFVVNKFNGKIYDNLLKNAGNMRQLKIFSNSSKDNQRAEYRNKWCFWKYPYLESIHWNDGVLNERSFRYLLKMNPSIKKMSFSRNISEALEFITKNELKLNKLSLKLNSKDITPICAQLNRLFHQNIYTKLHLTFGNMNILSNHMDDITSLQGLEGIEFPHPYHSSIATLNKLKELTIKSLGNDENNLNELPLLQKLHIEEASIESIRPLIRGSKNLKVVIMKSVKREPLPDIDNLIGERAQITGASPLNIFLEEWAYIKLKKYSATNHLVEIRRIESFQPEF